MSTQCFDNEKIYINKDIVKLIPVVCHYDSRTLLTKNGDLIQIIEISGFEQNDEFFQKIQLRGLVRDTLLGQVLSDKYSIYFYTMNNPRDIMPPVDFPTTFAYNLDREWCRNYSWGSQLVSCLYVAVVYQGNRISAFSPSVMIRSLLPKTFTKLRWRELDGACERLSSTVDGIVLALGRFGARVLTVCDEENGCIISQPLSFMYNLIHLREKKIELSACDASEQLAGLNCNYLFNTLELEELTVQAEPVPITYAAIFSIKPIHDLSLEACSLLLEHQYKYIISEILLFAPHYRAIREVKQHKLFAEAGKAKALCDINGISQIMQSDRGTAVDYCERQLTITLYGDIEEELQENVCSLLRSLHAIGIVVVREDFNMPMCFWSQVPGNFRYINRKSYNATCMSGTFAFVPNERIGCYNGSKWGLPITLFRTLRDTPYYFNFHVNDNGNTIVVGPGGSGKTTLLRFLVAQATRANPKIVSIDLKGNSEERFIQAIDGKMFKIEPQKSSPLQINFLNIKNFANNYELFRLVILDLLLQDLAKPEYVLMVERFLSVVVDNNVDTVDSESSLRSLAEETRDRAIIMHIEKFLNIWKYLCSADNMDIIKQNHCINLDLSALNYVPRLQYHFLWLLLLNLQKVLDGNPTIIMLNLAHILFEDNVFAECIIGFMESIQRSNAILVLSLELKPSLQNSKIFLGALPHFATTMLLSNRYADKTFKKVFGLSESEMHIIKSNDTEKRVVLMKQRGDSIAISYDLKQLIGITEILD